MAAMTPARMSIESIAQQIAASEPPGSMHVRVVAIDGHGGAGKSTLAGLLAAELADAPIVHTDDFASWDEPMQWWPRLLEQVLHPLVGGGTARYKRYDWDLRRLAEWIDVPAAAYVVVEGVSSSQIAFRPYLSFTIWVETPAATCLARGLERDGDDMLPRWEQWMAAEDRYVAREHPDRRADLVVAGSSTIEHDRSREVIALRRDPAS